MTKIELHVISDSPHTSAIITGFIQLQERGIVDLDIQLSYNKIHQYPHRHMIEAVINGSVVAYDLLDGYNWDSDLIEKYLDRVDFYFKRSYSDEKNLTITEKNREKIYPLGFNYHVTHKNNPIDISLNNNILLIAKLLLKTLLGYKKTRYFTTRVFEKSADYKNDNLRILFITRLWEPDSDIVSFNEEREYINQMRIQIVRELKKLYPQNFIGGIQNTPFACTMCKDIIVPFRYSIRNNYLKLVKQADICIGSMGLHESIGWKTGEYIAASRAIVNEELHYQVTGDFDIGKNYLSYNSVEECVKHVSYLIQNPDVVYEMKKENEKYYLNYLRPDKQILNSINIVLSNCDFNRKK